MWLFRSNQMPGTEIAPISESVSPSSISIAIIVEANVGAEVKPKPGLAYATGI